LKNSRRYIKIQREKRVRRQNGNEWERRGYETEGDGKGRFDEKVY